MQDTKKQINGEQYLDEFSDMLRASTIMLIRETPNGMAVLLVKRHENIEFAGGAYVFPGGRHDVGDVELLTPNAEILDVAKLAAIREAFEETGYLFARDKKDILVGDNMNNHKDRHKIINDHKFFVDFMKSHNLVPALDLIVPVSIWVPPDFARKRYLTWFFVAAVSEDTIIVPDGQEITDFIWEEATTALEKIERGEINALFPTMANLSLLSGFESFEQIKKYLYCKNMPLIRTKTIDKGINLWVETDIKDFYSYSTKQFH